jgi:thioesterase domain-containing protein
MSPLKLFLRARGCDARHWGLGTNRGEPERQGALLVVQISAQVEQTGRPIALIGWSLGGVIARETARQIPHAVSQVITYGTPVIGGPTYTLGTSRWGRNANALRV